MLKCAGILFLLANLTAICGFTAIVKGAATISNALFFLFMALIISSALMGTTAYKKETKDKTPAAVGGDANQFTNPI